MSLAGYVASLQNTKTYRSGLISFQEYSFQSRLFGLSRTLPSIPSADDDRHVIVMEIRGNQPNIRTVLKERGQSVQATTRDVDKLLFIFVEMRPHTLAIEKTAESYRLGDGHPMNAKFTVTYQVEDAREFWQSNRDQIAQLEMNIMDAARNFFLNLSSKDLISYPANLKQSLEKHILETEIGVVKGELEKSIHNSCMIAGVKVRKVIADIYIGDSLYDYLKRMHKKLYEPGGPADRFKIDQLIDSDATFYPYKLRAVIDALDMRLLSNFYDMTWHEAMRLVTEKVAEKKKEYMMSVEQKEINRWRELLNHAEDMGLDADDVKDLKFKIASKMTAMLDKEDTAHLLSDSEYLKKVIPISSDQLLESGDTTSSPKLK